MLTMTSVGMPSISAFVFASVMLTGIVSYAIRLGATVVIGWKEIRIERTNVSAAQTKTDGQR
ncbi:hypothetical protein [Rosistilla oblonga]|uniref:hypothetical protein n=1 Tax=Rosistilla oblonga TaxID=2527990 RepID=UPI003A9805C1